MTEDKEYRQAEKVLKWYVRNVDESQKLMAEVSLLRDGGDVHGQSYEVHRGSGGISDPVAGYVSRLMSAEQRLSGLMNVILAVDRMRADLLSGNVITTTSPRNLYLVLEMHYVKGMSASAVVRVLRWSRSIFFVRRRELLSLTGEYLRG